MKRGVCGYILATGAWHTQGGRAAMARSETAALSIPWSAMEQRRATQAKIKAAQNPLIKRPDMLTVRVVGNGAFEATLKVTQQTAHTCI